MVIHFTRPFWTPHFLILATPMVYYPRLFSTYLRREVYVFISVNLFVCLYVCMFVNSRIRHELINRFSQNSMEGGTWAPEETSTLWWWWPGSHYVRVRVGLRLGLRGWPTYSAWGCHLVRLFNGNSTATSAASADVCALLSVITLRAS